MNGSSGENLETEDLHYVGQNFIMEFFIPIYGIITNKSALHISLVIDKISRYSESATKIIAALNIHWTRSALTLNTQATDK